MRLSHRPHHLSALLLGGVLASAVVVAAQPETNPTAAALAAFTKQVNAYMDLHKKIEGEVPDVKKGATPAEVHGVRKGWRSGSRRRAPRPNRATSLRRTCTPVFKKIFADYYQRRSGREIRLLFDEVPNFKPAVNMTYPAGLAPKANFPPRLALTMPQLPDELEYRLVADNLVMRDSEANLIIDYIPNIVPSSPKR